jgi:type II secretion system protein H
MTVRLATSRRRRAFTLLEIMMVVAIMGLVMALGVPSLMGGLRKEGMRKAVSDVTEACGKARAQAILNGVTTEVRFHPQTKSFEVGASSSSSKASGQADTASEGTGNTGAAVGGFKATLPDNVSLEMLDVNFTELKDADEARVRFFPNGMCDELTVVLHSHDGLKKISLEITTSLAIVDNLR